MVDLDAADWRRAADLVITYADLPLGAVDASLVAVAERLELAEIATIDRRHFSVVRPRHIDAFTLRLGPWRRDPAALDARSSLLLDQAARDIVV